MTAGEILLTLFILNWVLVIGDASLGYFMMPLLLPPKESDSAVDTGSGEGTVVWGMRRLLAVMVFLYMLVNCYAFYQGRSTLLAVVTAVISLDILAQVVLRLYRLRRG